MPGTSSGGTPIPLDTDPAGDLADSVRDVVDFLEAGWTAYTPTLTATVTNPTLGTGSSVSGFYKRIGKTVFWRAVIQAGSAAVAAGSGTYSLSLPPILASTNQSNRVKGYGLIKDSATVAATAVAYSSSQTAVNMWGSNSTSIVAGALSGVIANRSYEFSGQYEAA
jgi:hypothetical protein